MPGFVKTPKDEAKWSKAKEAASKETKAGSTGYYKLSNFIFHKMKKREEQAGLAKQELAKQFGGMLQMSDKKPKMTGLSGMSSPMKVGTQATVKMPKAKKMGDGFGKPSLFFKSEDFKDVKKISIQNLRDFLDKQRSKTILSNIQRFGMSDNKIYSPKEAALAVLKKTEELLKKSELLTKYETEMSGKLGYKPSKYGKEEKEAEPSDKAFKVESEKAKTSEDVRLKHQPAPGNNPKEQDEGNNQPDGAEPRYEMKDKIRQENAKEKAQKFDKSEKLAKKYEGFKAVEESARESGAKDPAAVAAAVGRKKYGKEAFQHAAAKGKKMKKSEMEKHGLSPEEIASRLKKTGLSPEQIRAHLDKAEEKKYSKDLASENIEEHMHHLDRHPGGKKQAEAIGIEQARRGEHEKSEEKPARSIHEKHKPHGIALLEKFMTTKHAKRKSADMDKGAGMGTPTVPPPPAAPMAMSSKK